MRKSLLIVVAILLSGCAANYVKITKYDASGQWVPFADAKLGGYAIEKQGDISGLKVEYHDGKNILKADGGDIK